MPETHRDTPLPVLYDFRMAPSPRRARILLAEKGIAHETVTIDLAAGEHLGQAYRAINPQCTVPALKLPDGTILPDNQAIAAWAEAAHPEPAHGHPHLADPPAHHPIARRTATPGRARVAGAFGRPASERVPARTLAGP